MSNKLYVGNLSYSVRDDDLQQEFSAFGNVQSAKVMMERDTGRSKGFGFVEMSSPAEAQAAIDGLHGKNMGGRDLTVNIARPREDRPSGGGGGYGGGGNDGSFRSPYGTGPRGNGGGGGGRRGGGGYDNNNGGGYGY